jgi:hypothetical protein
MLTNVTTTVSEIDRIGFEGHIIPHLWYKNIVKPDGKPHLQAITILSDIIFWYRSQKVYDEQTGELVEVTKKFKDDKLQRSYKQFSKLFGLSPRQVKRTVDFLVEHNIVTVEFRTVTLKNGKKLNNVMYIEPNPEVIEKITTDVCNSAELKDKKAITRSGNRGITESGNRGITNSGGTNTEITSTEITNYRELPSASLQASVSGFSPKISLDEDLKSSFSNFFLDKTIKHRLTYTDMDVKSKVNKANKDNLVSKKKLSATTLNTFMNVLYSELNCPEYITYSLDKVSRNTLNKFIRELKTNYGMLDKDVYEFVEWLMFNWDWIKTSEKFSGVGSRSKIRKDKLTLWEMYGLRIELLALWKQHKTETLEVEQQVVPSYDKEAIERIFNQKH